MVTDLRDAVELGFTGHEQIQTVFTTDDHSYKYAKRVADRGSAQKMHKRLDNAAELKRLGKGIRR